MPGGTLVNATQNISTSMKETLEIAAMVTAIIIRLITVMGWTRGATTAELVLIILAVCCVVLLISVSVYALLNRTKGK